MAKSQTGDKPKRERRPARSIEERIAELQARAEAKQQRARAKAAAELAALNERVTKLQTKLDEALKARDAALAVLGEEPTTETDPEPVSE